MFDVARAVGPGEPRVTSAFERFSETTSVDITAFPQLEELLLASKRAEMTLDSPGLVVCATPAIMIRIGCSPLAGCANKGRRRRRLRTLGSAPQQYDWVVKDKFIACIGLS